MPPRLGFFLWRAAPKKESPEGTARINGELIGCHTRLELGLLTMSPKVFVRLPLMTFGILSVAVVAEQPTSVTAEEYPRCSQGSILRCYYMTREQCEEAVDYHGFCVANSNAPSWPPPNRTLL